MNDMHISVLLYFETFEVMEKNLITQSIISPISWRTPLNKISWKKGSFFHEIGSVIYRGNRSFILFLNEHI